MNWNLAALLIPYLLGLVIPVSVGIYALRHRHVLGARQYGLYVIVRSVWNLGLLFEILSSTLKGKYFWLILETATVPFILVLLASFTFTFTDSRSKKYGLVWGLITLSSAILLLLILTNSWHRLIIDQVYFEPSLPFSLLHVNITTVDWAVLIYCTVIILVFFGIFIEKFFHAQSLYRSQVLTIMLGVLIDITGIWFALSLNRRIIIPLASVIGYMIVAWGLFRYHLFDLRPVARETLFEKMDDIVIVLDAQDRIADINPTALTELNLTASETIGKPASQVLSAIPDWNDLLEAFCQPANKSIEFGFEQGADFYHFDIKSTLLYDRHNNYQGRIFVARNVTIRARMRWQLKELNEELQALNQDLENRVRRRTLELSEAYDTTLQGWARALELRDKETEGHSRRVTEMTLKLARALDIAEAELDDLHRGALLHDIGKMAIPDEILRKPGKLTVEERKIMEQHPIYSLEFLSNIPYLEKAIEIPYCHHEHWDGSGYPRRLKGEEIPLSARIFTIIDAWDAVQSDRPYNHAWSREEAILYLREEAGKIFDPQCLGIFLALVEQGKI